MISDRFDSEKIAFPLLIASLAPRPSILGVRVIGERCWVPLFARTDSIILFFSFDSNRERHSETGMAKTKTTPPVNSDSPSPSANDRTMALEGSIHRHTWKHYGRPAFGLSCGLLRKLPEIPISSWVLNGTAASRLCLSDVFLLCVIFCPLRSAATSHKRTLVRYHE